GDLARLASHVAALRGNPEEALQLADRVAPAARKYTDVLWQAELAFAKGVRGGEVDELARQATEMAPQVPNTWLARVTFLALEGKTDEARQVAEQAAQKLPDQPPYLRPMALGYCYEKIGDRTLAERNFSGAVEADPQNYIPHVELSNYYLRGNELQKAQKQVE